MAEKEQKVIGIRLGKKDDDLKQWLKLVKEKKLEQSFYFKKAILAHIKGEKIEIGRINKVKDDKISFTSLTLTPNDTELLKFVEDIDSQPTLKTSTYLKEVFRAAITYTDGEEYIPSYIEMYPSVSNSIHNSSSYIKSVPKESNSIESSKTSSKNDDKNVSNISKDNELAVAKDKPVHPLLGQMFSKH